MYNSTSMFLQSELDYRTERLTAPRSTKRRPRRKHFQPLYTRRANGA
jgi:hypothetical protein